MKETILRFRKLYNYLIADRLYNKSTIIIASKISWPTLQKILNAPIEEIKVQASVLALMQDYMKIHAEKFLIIDAENSKPSKELVIHPANYSLKENNDVFPAKHSSRPIHYEKHKIPVKSEEDVNKLFWDTIALIHKRIPDGIQVTVTIIAKRKQ